MTDDELLASVMRKILKAPIYGDIVNNADGTSDFIVDGWVPGITAEELAVMESVWSSQ